jgi:hypothetical protein
MYSRNKDDMDDLLDDDRKLTKEQEQVMLDLGTKAKSIFETLLAQNSDKIEYIYYHALSTSMYALGKSTFAIIMEGLIGKYNKSLKILNGDYSPIRTYSLKLIGRYYFVLPWPKRDLELSEKYLKEAIKLNPGALVNYLFLGDALWESDKNKEAEYYWSAALKNNSIPQGIPDKISNNYCRNMITKRLVLSKK